MHIIFQAVILCQNFPLSQELQFFQEQLLPCGLTDAASTSLQLHMPDSRSDSMWNAQLVSLLRRRVLDNQARLPNDRCGRLLQYLSKEKVADRFLASTHAAMDAYADEVVDVTDALFSPTSC